MQLRERLTKVPRRAARDAMVADATRETVPRGIQLSSRWSSRDELSPARGIAKGLLGGFLVWAVIATLAWLLWPSS